MQTQLQQAGSITVVFLEGDLERATSNGVTDAITQALATDCTDIVLSFRGVRTLYSEGIRLLVSLHDQVEKAGKTFHLTDLPPEAKYTLKITNLLDFLGYCDDLEAFLRSHTLSQTDLAPVQPPPTSPSAPQAKTAAPEASQTPSSGPSSKQHAANADVELSEDELRKLVARYIPGRIALDIIRYFVEQKKSVADVATLAEITGTSEKVVRKMAKQLVVRGILKDLGSDQFNYAPETKLRGKVDYFLKLWHRPRQQARLLSILLSVER